MINSLNGPVLLNDAFGALLSFNLALMLKYVGHPKASGSKVEYGVPFFDDLDATEKAIALHTIIVAMFDPESPLLKETAYHTATLAALENYMKEGVKREIEMRYWSENKYGKEDCILRKLTIAAFQSRYPLDQCPDAESIEAVTFTRMIDRLFADIRPQPYFLIADVPKTKRSILMKRLAAPDEYFAPLEGKEKMPENERQEQYRFLLTDAMSICESVLTADHRKTEQCWWERPPKNVASRKFVGSR